MSQTYLRPVNGDVTLVVDATSGDETVPLPPRFATQRRFIVRRSDASANAVTVTVATGGAIDGVTNGTATVGPRSEVAFTSLDLDAWLSNQPMVSGSGILDGTVTPADLASTVPAALAADDAFTGTFVPAVIVTGTGIDPTGATDSTAAIQAAITSLPASGGRLYFPPGRYLISGLTIDRPLVMQGAGSAGATLGAIPTALICSSTTANAVVVNSAGVTIEDLAILNTAAGTPTAGAGISYSNGYYTNLTRVTVQGFYNNVTVTNAWYYNFTDCRFFDAVHYGNMLGNSTNADVGGGVIKGCSYSTAFVNRASAAFVRWESGGGLRFLANKLNGASAVNPGSIFVAAPAQGFDCAVADGASTVDILFQGNSIENIGGAGFYLRKAGPANTGALRNILVQGNEFQACGSGVNITPAGSLTIGDIIVAGNVFESCFSNGVSADNVDRIHIGTNVCRNTAMAGSGIVKLGASVARASVDHQVVDRTSVVLLENDAEDSTDGAVMGQMQPDWVARFDNSSLATYQTLWRFWPVNTGGGIIELTLSGRCPGVGPFMWHARRSYIQNGGVTLTTIGTDVQAGGFAGMDLLFDVASVSGEVQVKVRPTGSATRVAGRAILRVDGAIKMMRLGA